MMLHDRTSINRAVASQVLMYRLSYDVAVSYMMLHARTSITRAVASQVLMYRLSYDVAVSQQ